MPEILLQLTFRLRLKMKTINLFLIHGPKIRKQGIPEAWNEMLSSLVDELAQSVGVSNFNVSQLEEIRHAALELPAVNQISLTLTAMPPKRASCSTTKTMAFR